MNIKNQISLIDNPQNFTSLVRKVFVAEYGDDYQPIDDSQKDNGNDGYIKSEKKVIARHCFVNLKKQTSNRDIIQKATSDLRKAKEKLSESGRLSFEKWTFVSNYDIPEAVFTEVRKVAKEIGLGEDNIHFVGPSELEDLIKQHEEIWPSIPFLEILAVSKKVDKILKIIESENDNFPVPEKITMMESARNINLPKREKTEDFLRAEELTDQLQKKGLSQGIKDELKELIYTSDDLNAQLQAIITITGLYREEEDDIDGFITFADLGQNIAETKSEHRAKGAILSSLIQLLTNKYIIMDSNGAYNNRIMISLGIKQDMQDMNERKNLINRLHKLEEKYYQVIEEAIKAANLSGDYQIIGNVLIGIGSSAGARAIHFRGHNLPNRAEIEEQVSKKSFLQAKNLFLTVGDQHSMAYAMHDLANTLRFLGEEKEAEAITQKVIPLSIKFKDKLLEENSTELLKEIRERNAKK